MKRSTGNQGFQIWIDKLKLWLKEQTYAENSLLLIENSSWDTLRSDELPDADLPIWIAAQRAVSRYEGILSPVGPRGRLLRRLLAWTGLIPSLPEATIKSDVETEHLEGYVRLDPEYMLVFFCHLGALLCLLIDITFGNLSMQQFVQTSVAHGQLGWLYKMTKNLITKLSLKTSRFFKAQSTFSFSCAYILPSHQNSRSRAVALISGFLYFWKSNY